ncbi:MAG: hypothetical protein A2169_03050 [Deltaproteobacteria bacterium RBG_13_47_9]|nr:MAG: hypothetical protein A2169_03050 [Deltaproteobacteria bacterium RBG_13_47_9]
MIFPKERPALKNLNSYYVNIPKLLEYCQREFGVGCIHLKSSEGEGAFFFEKGNLLNSVFQDREKEVKGEEAVHDIIDAAVKIHFDVDVYQIPSEKIHFWANLSRAEKIYENLSTEFADFEGLLKKMEIEKLTGYIDVSLNKGKEGGIIFFDHGKVAGGSYSWDDGEVNDPVENQKVLLEKTKELGGVFHISRIPLPKPREEHPLKETTPIVPSHAIGMLEELLVVFERIVMSNKKIKGRFNTLLKNKFMEKADKYIFLNPFSGEFEYANKKIAVRGDVSDEELIPGVIESVKELAEEFDMISSLNHGLVPWTQRYQKELMKFGVSF